MKFIISQTPKSAMQSGKKNSKKWIMTIVEEDNSRSINELMGWTSSNTTKTQLKFTFNTKEQAEEYAKKNNFEYQIIENKKTKIIAKSYASNFLN
jgi:hypothetical protein